MSVPLLVRALPMSWRRRLYTGRLGFRPGELAGLVFKVADCRTEWEQAFRLLHTISVQRGIYPPKPSGMRIAPYHALPTTAVIVAMHGDRVVGTMTLVEDSPLGLPMEAVFPGEVERLRVRKCRVAEVSMLAVDPAFRGTGMTMTMNRVMWRWAYFYRKVTDLVIAVRPSITDYYATVLLFAKEGPQRPYQSLNNVPVLPMRLNLETAVARYQQAYGEKIQPGLRNLYRFMVLDREISAVKLPRRLNHIWVESDVAPSMSAEDFRYFFLEQEAVLEHLDEPRRRFLARCYSGNAEVVAALNSA